ncbi:D-isomer specific 2-hydroxyacid dehydrogenase [Entophlyctis helioformis]|nr:D-isomer specific 2-hydroxyacid dehydrogenase [Entophlyctis helioformis]
MCVFDFKQHEKVSFEHAVSVFQQTRAIDVRYLPFKLSAETVTLAAGCQVVCIFVNDVANADILTRLAALGVKCIALRCAGFNNVDLKAAHALGLEVVRVPAYSPYAVAEHATALILSLNRKIVHAYSRVKQGNFSLNNLVGFDLHGKTVGVLGTGKIGQCFIKIMLGFGCNVLCYDVYRSDEVATWANVRYVDSLDELYAKSKVISLHLPLLPTTKYIINAESMAKMQPGVMIINTSRGPLINTIDLIAALKSGQVGSAGLDVYEEESAYFFEDLSGTIMSDDKLARLMTFNNVIITSHQAFLTEEALQAIAQTTLLNVTQFLDGKKGSELTNNVA